jgi:hypothetical protein
MTPTTLTPTFSQPSSYSDLRGKRMIQSAAAQKGMLLYELFVTSELQSLLQGMGLTPIAGRVRVSQLQPKDWDRLAVVLLAVYSENKIKCE